MGCRCCSAPSPSCRLQRVLPLMVLRFLRKRRHKMFGLQLPEALELITRSLKAGHPVPVAIAMVAREMPDPIGTEFGVVADEVTYGSDLVSALQPMYGRVGHEDLPLFVTAVSIQSTSGGNLREILDGLAPYPRTRQVRRKVRAISTEGRMSAYILTAVPRCWGGHHGPDAAILFQRLGQGDDLVPARRLGSLADARQRDDVQDVQFQVLAPWNYRPPCLAEAGLDDAGGAFHAAGRRAAMGWPLLSGGDGRSDVKRR